MKTAKFHANLQSLSWMKMELYDRSFYFDIAKNNFTDKKCGPFSTSICYICFLNSVNGRMDFRSYQLTVCCWGVIQLKALINMANFINT